VDEMELEVPVLVDEMELEVPSHPVLV